ncbi:methyltransferase domain-containing protein [Luteimonas sp. TWI382]|uniref:class I SAM-dependent methyltransferase n=2 Tax=Luteimonas TaxID=83614 RepID=UPI0032099090
MNARGLTFAHLRYIVCYMTSSSRHAAPPEGGHAEDTARAFWERIYAGRTTPPSGRPSKVLTRFAEGRTPGRALELGCARGDDAIWLAQRGWMVTGVDISETALEAARVAASAAGVAGHVQFERHDLGERFLPGTFDLVTALFLQSPMPFGRTQVLRRAAQAVGAGGLLLLVTHGSRAPWSWRAPDTVYPSAADELAALALAPAQWREVFVGSLSRTAFGPSGEQASVLDTIVAIERR